MTAGGPWRPEPEKEMGISMSLEKLILLMAVVGLALVLASSVQALMPPHVSHTEPAAGGELGSNIILIHGYTLGIVDLETLKVTDLTENRPVKIETEFESEVVGEGDCEGCRQLRCTITVRLLRACPGHDYRIDFLDEAFVYKYQGRPVSCP